MIVPVLPVVPPSSVHRTEPAGGDKTGLSRRIGWAGRWVAALRVGIVRLEPLPHADDVIHGVTYSPPECDSTFVGRADLEVNLGTAQLAQALLSFLNDQPRKPAALMTGVDRDIVEPTPMPLVSRHRRRDDPTVDYTDQEQLRPHPELPLDVFVRVISWANQATASPQRDDSFLILGAERANLHRGHYLMSAAG